jgi:hypothetical protein
MSKLYVVFYTLVGERCNGTWLVHANNKRQGAKLIRDSYTECGDRIVVDLVQTLPEYASDLGYESVDEMIDDGLLVEKQHYDRVAKTVGEYEQIECGT